MSNVPIFLLYYYHPNIIRICQLCSKDGYRKIFMMWYECSYDFILVQLLDYFYILNSYVLVHKDQLIRTFFIRVNSEKIKHNFILFECELLKNLALATNTVYVFSKNVSR